MITGLGGKGLTQSYYVYCLFHKNICTLITESVYFCNDDEEGPLILTKFVYVFLEVFLDKNLEWPFFMHFCDGQLLSFLSLTLDCEV